MITCFLLCWPYRHRSDCLLVFLFHFHLLFPSAARGLLLPHELCLLPCYSLQQSHWVRTLISPCSPVLFSRSNVRAHTHTQMSSSATRAAWGAGGKGWCSQWVSPPAPLSTPCPPWHTRHPNLSPLRPVHHVRQAIVRVSAAEESIPASCWVGRGLGGEEETSVSPGVTGPRPPGGSPENTSLHRPALLLRRSCPRTPGVRGTVSHLLCTSLPQSQI